MGHRDSSKSSGDAVIPLDHLTAQSRETAGGKGASLSRMIAAGLPVPAGFVIAATAFEQFLAECGAAPTITQLTTALDVEDSIDVERAARVIQRAISSAGLPDSLERSIRAAYGCLRRDGAVAVRSSAACEDGETASFAGQQETYLNVRGADAVVRRVRECWMSFFSARALFYRAQKGMPGDARMAVVVQEMVQADKSGVMFTVDPIRNRRECLVIEGATGLGEALVSGNITPDHYVVARADATLVDQFIPGGRDRILSDAELSRLAGLGLHLERFFGSPQDIEWCIRGGEVLLLQSRPITTLNAHG